MKVILNTFRTKFGYTGEATNEMEEVVVNAFSLNEVEFLCECYTLSGFIIDEKSKNNLWKLTHKISNGIPYYVSIIFNIIQTKFNKIITKENIELAYKDILNNTKNHKSFNQLLDRISIYYSEPKEQAIAMKTILNFVSKQSDFISEKEIINGIDLDKDVIKDSLYILFSDHYLVREIKDKTRHYKFKYEIFRQWWRINIA